MKWLQLCIDTARGGLDPLEAMLAAQGIDGIEIEDEEDFKQFLEHNEKYWDYVDEDLMEEKASKCRIKFYLSDDEEGMAQVAHVRMAMEQVKADHPDSDLGPMILSLEHVEDADWENNWKQYYQPIEIGERLIIVPEWLQAETGNRTPLILDRAGLWHRQPRHHPHVLEAAGSAHPRRRAGAGSGLRQRHFIHCGIVPGRAGGRGLRY